MWTVLSYDGSAVYWNPDWDDVVRWARRQGGELEVRFDPFFRSGDHLRVVGNVDQFGDLGETA